MKKNKKQKQVSTLDVFKNDVETQKHFKTIEKDFKRKQKHQINLVKLEYVKKLINAEIEKEVNNIKTLDFGAMHLDKRSIKDNPNYLGLKTTDLKYNYDYKLIDLNISYDENIKDNEWENSLMTQVSRHIENYLFGTKNKQYKVCAELGEKYVVNKVIDYDTLTAIASVFECPTGKSRQDMIDKAFNFTLERKAGK